MQRTIADSAAVELPTIANGDCPAMVGNSSPLCAALDADHPRNVVMNSPVPLRQQQLGMPVAVVASGLWSSLAEHSRLSRLRLNRKTRYDCKALPFVGDCPNVERSSRSLALTTLPHVAALVTPSVRVRTPANLGTRQGLSRSIPQSRGWA